MARFPGEWRLQILPLYVRNAFHLEIPEDPSVARREAVSDGLASMEEVFLAKVVWLKLRRWLHLCDATDEPTERRSSRITNLLRDRYS